jgi:hypothetical protein
METAAPQSSGVMMMERIGKITTREGFQGEMEFGPSFSRMI